MNKTKVFITGITSMDGSFMAEQLLEKDCQIFGLKRRSSVRNTWRIDKIINDIEIVTGDLTDSASLNRAIQLIKPDFVINLAAQSFVKASWECPEYTLDVNGTGVIRLLEAVRMFSKNNTKFLQSSSSEQFGKVRQTPQTEFTPFYPRSIYGISKITGYWIVVNYRESYNMFASNSISFNHTSHRRGLEFVCRKICHGVAMIHCKKADYIELGNLESERDFGYAPEYTQAMWKILQLDEPVDLVLGTGEKHSIKEFVQEAFSVINIPNWQDHVRQNPKYMRPAEVDCLIASSRKARKLIKWFPKVNFRQLVAIMVNADIERIERGDVFNA